MLGALRLHQRFGAHGVEQSVDKVGQEQVGENEQTVYNVSARKRFVVVDHVDDSTEDGGDKGDQ